MDVKRCWKKLLGNDRVSSRKVYRRDGEARMAVDNLNSFWRITNVSVFSKTLGELDGFSKVRWLVGKTTSETRVCSWLGIGYKAWAIVRVNVLTMKWCCKVMVMILSIEIFEINRGSLFRSKISKIFLEFISTERSSDKHSFKFYKIVISSSIFDTFNIFFNLFSTHNCIRSNIRACVF